MLGSSSRSFTQQLIRDDVLAPSPATLTSCNTNGFAMLVIVLVAASAVAANVVTDLTETQFDGLVGSNVVAATLVFRAGGSGTWTISASGSKLTT